MSFYVRVALSLVLITAALNGALAQPSPAGKTEALLNVSKGQILDDTGSDGQTKMTLEKSAELGGQALKVVFAPGDSIGDRVSRIKNWSPYSKLSLTAFNPSKDPVSLELNIKHSGTTSFQTRAVYPINLPSGKTSLSITLKDLLNVNGSRPDLANVSKWYLNCETGQTPTLYFGDIVLESPGGKSATGGQRTQEPTKEAPTGSFRVRGSIGSQPVDLAVTPLTSTEAVENEPKVSSDPARVARIRKLTMPKITKVISFDTPEADAILSAMEIFPSNNPWNLVVSDWPVHSNSDALVSSIGTSKFLRVNEDMCFVIVPPNQKRVNVTLAGYSDESDKGPFPIPDNLPIEGWPKSPAKTSLADAQRRPPKYEGDRHAIVVDPTAGKLYEFFVMGRTNDGWTADQSSVFDIRSNRLRPDGWTSADAAGLPIFPAVIRFDELQRGEVEHAMRFTVRRSRKSYVYPATHHAGHGFEDSLPRMGERFRLKQNVDISDFSPFAQAILKGLKKYGMFVADNGLEWSLSMTPDPRIPDLHDELRKIKGSDFEVVEPPKGYEPPPDTKGGPKALPCE